jgi:osmotically-inducible protein OsmY
MFKTYAGVLALSVMALAGCARRNESPAVADNIRKSLDQAGLKSVSVSQNRDIGVVTLTGNVPTDAAKSQAESIAKNAAGGQVVSDQIAVVPPNGSQTKTLYADLDKGIQDNLDAALIQNKIPGSIRHSAKNGVVTLTGSVDSDNARQEAQQVASSIPNVQEVVNELQVKKHKATATK